MPVINKNNSQYFDYYKSMQLKFNENPCLFYRKMRINFNKQELTTINNGRNRKKLY